MKKGKPLKPSITIEAWYYHELRVMVLAMQKAMIRAVEKPHEQIAMDKIDGLASVEARAQELRDKFAKTFSRLGAITAARFLDKQIEFASRSFVRSVRGMVEGSEPSLMLSGSIVNPANVAFTEESIAANVSLIKSIGSQYFDRIEKELMKSLQTGGSQPDLIKAIRKTGGVTERRAKFIARDQNSKIYSQLATNQMERAGITKVMWKHSGAGRNPRSYHKRRWDGKSEPPNGLNGYVYQIGNPPVADLKTGERAAPGELINCRCYATPVLF